MVSKDELRKQVDDLKQRVSELSRQRNEWMDRAVEAESKLECIEERKKADISAFKEMFRDSMQEMIDESMKKLRADVSCDYGGYVMVRLDYNGSTLSEDYDQVVTDHCGLEE